MTLVPRITDLKMNGVSGWSRACPGQTVTATTTVEVPPLYYPAVTLAFWGRFRDSDPWTYLGTLVTPVGITGGTFDISYDELTLPQVTASNTTYYVGVSLVPLPPPSVTHEILFYNPQPRVTLGATRSSGTAPLEVGFQLECYDTNYITNITWNFGDGTGDVPGGQYEYHTYTMPGNYTAVAKAKHFCNNLTTKSIAISVAAAPPVTPPTPTGCTNPTGSANQLICGNPSYSNAPVSTTQYKCVSGTWRAVAENSPVCGYTPPAGYASCTNPAGAHGTVRCIGLDRAECNDGTWTIILENAPVCADTSGGGGNGGGDTFDSIFGNIDRTTLILGLAGVMAALGIGLMIGKRRGE